MGKINDIFKKIDSIILIILKTITIICITLIACMVLGNIFVRHFPIVSLHWFDEIVELLYAYLVFYGAAALWMHREHFSVGDWISKYIKNEKLIKIYKIILEILILSFALIFFYYSYQLTIRSIEVTNAFQIPKKVLYSCMPISGLIMVIYSIIHVILEITNFFKSDNEEKKVNI